MIKRLLFVFMLGALPFQAVYAKKIQNCDWNYDNGIHIWDFIDAAGDGELFKVKSLVSRNVLNFGCKYNQWAVDTALQNATKNGHLEVVKYLVEDIGVDINHHSKNDNPILLEAADKGHLAIVQYLVSKGANVNAKGKCDYPALYDSANDAIWDYLKPKTTGLNTSLAFINAARRGNLEQVKSFLEQLKQEGKDMNDTIDDIIGSCSNNSALSEAGKYGHLSVVKYLIENNDWDLKVVKGWWGNYNNLPLEIRQKLPQYGTFYNNARFALNNAAKYGHLNIVKYLVSMGADVQVDLFATAQNGHLDIIQYLVSQGTDITKSNTLSGAIYGNNLEIVKYALSQGANATYGDLSSATEQIKLRSPLQTQAEANRFVANLVEIIRLLVANGANVNCDKCKRESPLMTAIYSARFTRDERQIYLHCFEVIKILVNNGTNVNYQNERGETALMYAVTLPDNTDITQYLLQHGASASINLIDERGETALDKALGSAQATLLKRYGAKHNKYRESSNTPKAPPNVHIKNHKSDSPRNTRKFPPNVNIRIID